RPPRQRSLAPLFASQSTVPSTEPLTTRRPSGENAALIKFSVPFAWPGRQSDSAPVSVSQTRTVLSGDAEAIRLPSGDNCQAFRRLYSSRCRQRSSAPLAASQIRTAPSSDSLITRRPSDENVDFKLERGERSGLEEQWQCSSAPLAASQIRTV